MNINKGGPKTRRMSKLFRKGFAFSELLLAVLFFVCVFTMTMGSFIACILLNEANRNLLIATSHAQYVMEEIKNKASTISGFNDLTASYVDTNWDWPNEAAINAKGLAALTDESIDTNITGTTLRDIAVTVNWHDRGNRNRSIILETIIVEP